MKAANDPQCPQRARDGRVIVTLTAPHDTRLSFVDTADTGPWWSAVIGSLALNALIFWLALKLLD